MAAIRPPSPGDSRRTTRPPTPLVTVQGVLPVDDIETETTVGNNPASNRQSQPMASTSTQQPQPETSTSNQPSQPDTRPSYWSHALEAQVSMSSLAREIEAFRGWDRFLKGAWKTIKSFYPDYLYEMEEKSVMIKSLFRGHAQYTVERWRQVGLPLPKLYPSRDEWHEIHHLGVLLARCLELYVVKGEENEVLVTKYFINFTDSNELVELLQEGARHITTATRIPKWGIPSHMMREGMQQHEAQLASALFRAEAEMAIYKIFVATLPGNSNQMLLRNPALIWTFVKPLWKETQTPTRRPQIPSGTRISRPSVSSAQRTPRAEGRRRAAPQTLDEETEDDWDALSFTPQSQTTRGTRKVMRIGNTYTSTS